MRQRGPGLFDETRPCATCAAPVVPPTVNCCCSRCGCETGMHTDSMRCRRCRTECGQDCTPPWFYAQHGGRPKYDLARPERRRALLERDASRGLTVETGQL